MTNPFSRNTARYLAAALLLTLLPPVLSGQNPAPAPSQLLPPPGTKLILHAKGKGDQVYTCKENNSQYAWILKEPQAQLFDESGKLIGRHFAGPAWQLNDKSQVTGKVVARADSPSPNAIPWFLLAAVDHSGSGMLEHVTDIQRLNTFGGKAPDTGCDAAHINAETRVPYSADYYFFTR
jgi:hypothetical protein